MDTALKQRIIETGNLLTESIHLFSNDQINKVPFEGSWTAGQVVDHILKAGNGAYEMVYGEAKSGNRPYDEKDAEMKALFLNMEIKMQSPVDILPSTSPLDKTQLINNVQHMISKLSKASSELNLTELCTSFEFPGQGSLTRFEWLSFFTYHTQRHINQLNKIFYQL